MKMTSIGLAFLFLMLHVAQARVVTMLATNYYPAQEIQIALGEVAELTGWSGFSPDFGGISILTFVKDGVEVKLPIPPVFQNVANRVVAISPPKHRIAGPATIRLRTNGTYEPIYCTFNITPETFPVDKTFILPPGTNQVAVSLECSTNLVNWLTATNGVYGSPTDAKFFRIQAQTAN